MVLTRRKCLLVFFCFKKSSKIIFLSFALEDQERERERGSQRFFSKYHLMYYNHCCLIVWASSGASTATRLVATPLRTFEFILILCFSYNGFAHYSCQTSRLQQLQLQLTIRLNNRVEIANLGLNFSKCCSFIHIKIIMAMMMFVVLARN